MIIDDSSQNNKNVRLKMSDSSSQNYRQYLNLYNANLPFWISILANNSLNYGK